MGQCYPTHIIISPVKHPKPSKRKTPRSPDENCVDIVYIDGSVVLRKAFKHIVMKQNWTCQTFSNGLDAITWFQTHTAKLLFVDKFMLDMDGIETIRQLFKYDIPTFGITMDKQDNHEMIKVGAKRVLIKPVTLTMLYSIINKYCL